MFRLEVKDIDGKSDVIKEGFLAVWDHTGQSAVIIKEDMVGLDIFMECTLDHFLCQDKIRGVTGPWFY